jgi:VanZ family protein
MHKTAAWPLSLMYVVLVVYASLYPFAEWRDQGIAPWAFLLAPLPRYWTGFDVAINMVGYAPLGGLLALSVLRTRSSTHPVLLPLLLAAVLSLAMESLQTYLPTRVPSKEAALFCWPPGHWRCCFLRRCPLVWGR